MRKRYHFLVSLICLAVFILFVLLANKLIQYQLHTQKNPEQISVMVINIDPFLRTQGNRRLHELEQERIKKESRGVWNNDPRIMTDAFIKDMNDVSDGNMNYELKEFINVDEFPAQCDQVNGQNCSAEDKRFHFTEEAFLRCLDAVSPSEKKQYCHDPNVLDYEAILSRYSVCEKRNSDEIDEVWIFHRFWLGVWESNMTGPGAFHTNGESVDRTSCKKPTHIMGFSYERPVENMLHNMGHRVEGVMNHVFGYWIDLSHPQKPLSQFTAWEKFALGTNDAGFISTCGIVHGLINSGKEYDYENKALVQSTCNDWLNYPSLAGKTESINCTAWSCTEYGFMKFWLSHIPKADGRTNGKWNNWWLYNRID